MGKLWQLIPSHSPQAREHSSPCFLHMHRFDRQSDLQLHRIIFNKSSGAVGRSVVHGSSLSEDNCHPHISGCRLQAASIQT